MDERNLFIQAIQVEDPPGRIELLRQACGGDEPLRRRVEELLEAHDRAASFLESPPADVAPTSDQLLTERPGTKIGPYKLLEIIGEGGFGVVFMAEQTQPVRRKVALKIIKPGMDTRQVIARFEAERQALALMEHPNIARVLEAGATESGRPYFVMELVKGIAITDYCDQCRLPTRERLALFIAVCRAVQHAHQKGIIHRDLKPSNVMVTLRDGTPTVKVIDFGIAKATGQQLTDKTMFTGFGQLIGTPMYMSPEQAALSEVDVDTRSDVYALGVLLYELLTGTTPFDKDTIRTVGVDELRRIIREDEPPTPSARLSTLHVNVLSTMSEQRPIDPHKLSQEVRGELDWIVMKALDKDRNRRYESASALAADVQHYLDDEPVAACPPSATYRLGKFARRHRTFLTTSCLVGLALILGTTVSVWQAIEANHARNTADKNLVLANEARQQAEANFEKALEAVDRLLMRVGDNTLNQVPQMEQVQKRVLQDAVEFYDGFLADHPDNPQVRYKAAIVNLRIGQVYSAFSENSDADAVMVKACALLRQLHAEQPDNRQIQVDLAYSYCHLGIHARVVAIQEGYQRRAIELLVPLVNDPNPIEGQYTGKDSIDAGILSDARYLLARTYSRLGGVLTAQDRTHEAEQAFHTSLALYDGGYQQAYVYRGLAHLFVHTDRLPEAVDAFHQSIDQWQRRLDPGFKIPSETINTRGAVHQWRQHYETVRTSVIHRFISEDSRDLGDALTRANRCEEAVLPLQQAIETSTQLLRDFPTRPIYRDVLSTSYRLLGVALEKLGRTDEAEQAFRSSTLTLTESQQISDKHKHN